MIRIKYNDSDEMHDVEFSRGDHVVTLIGDIEPNTSGFTTWRMDGKTQLGDFCGHTTVYRTLDNGVQYSDDGSVYKEPEQPDVEPDGKPSTEYRIQQLEAQNETLLECLLEMSDIVYA